MKTHEGSNKLVFLTVILMDILAGIEFDIFVPSFPELQTAFNLSPFWVEALLSVNFAGYCLSLFFVGILADRYGRKPVILFGLSLFTIGSIFCIYGTSYSILLLGRFLQGLGVAPVAVLSFIIIADSYPLYKQQQLLALLNAVMNISVGIAPVIGSYLTLYFHWQGNFKALFYLGLVVLVMVTIFVPSYEKPKHPEKFSLAAYKNIFRSKPLMLLIINLVSIFIPYWVFVGISPILFMKDLGVSLPLFGFYQGALAFIFAIGCLVFSAIIYRCSQIKMLNYSNYLFMLSFITIFIVSAWNISSPLIILLALLPYVIAEIVPTSILYPLSLNLLPEAKGRISALVLGLRLMLTSLSLQIAGHYYSGSIRNTGIILLFFIGVIIISNYYVMKNRVLIDKIQS